MASSEAISSCGWSLTRKIAVCQVRVYIIYHRMLNILVGLQDVKEHSAAAYKWFDISNIIPSGKVSGKHFFELSDELSFSAHPFDERFAFCHKLNISYHKDTLNPGARQYAEQKNMLPLR